MFKNLEYLSLKNDHLNEIPAKPVALLNGDLTNPAPDKPAACIEAQPG
jgi:hypothetical protein